MFPQGSKGLEASFVAESTALFRKNPGLPDDLLPHLPLPGTSHFLLGFDRLEIRIVLLLLLILGLILVPRGQG